jgi:hypothetical protein
MCHEGKAYPARANASTFAQSEAPLECSPALR